MNIINDNIVSSMALLFVFAFIGSVTCQEYFTALDYLNYENAKIELDSSITLTASPTKLNASGEWATVSWSGVSKPDKDDWIGVYAPPVNGNSIDPKKQAPVKYQYCNSSSAYMKDGKGTLKFYMVNLRVPYIFGLLRNGFSDPTLAATSNTIQFINPNEPLQGHLMMTDDPTQMKLMWVTRDSDSPEVKYGLTVGTAIAKIKATSTTYTAKDLCGPPANETGFIDPGQLHTAVLKDLVPGKNFSYSFGDDKYGWSKTHMFTVPPLPDPKVTTKFIAFGDMGQGQPDNSIQETWEQPPSLNTTKLIEKEINSSATTAVLHIGDTSYANGYAIVWDEFFDQIQPIATRVPYMVCIGNHERDYPNSGSLFDGKDSGGECGVPYEMRFQMPRPGKDQNWYTFKTGSAQVVLMSTEHNFTIGSKQYEWIKDTLSKVDKKRTPWLIFIGHRPMYCDSESESPPWPAGVQAVAKELRTNIEPLLMHHKVDLALWGHHHSYQRTCQVYQEKCTKGAPVHAVIGMAGHILSQNILSKQPEWIEYIDIEHYGYTRITTNEKTLLFEYVRDDDGKVHDTLKLP